MSIREMNGLAGLVEYPQEFFVEEDEMGDSRPQGLLMRYLVSVLEWLYYKEKWMVATNFHHYHPAIQNSRHLIIPDVAVFKDINIPAEEQTQLKSWHIAPPERPAPPVVFEISSSETWNWDIGSEFKQKPSAYGWIGVQEYFAYDPNKPPVWSKQEGRRLLGWRYENGQPIALQPDKRGRLWSNVLESWLKEDGLYLRLYDRRGHLRLTKDEADTKARQLAEQHASLVERQNEQLTRALQIAEQQNAQLEIEIKARQLAEHRAILAEQEAAQLKAALQGAEQLITQYQEQNTQLKAALEEQKILEPRVGQVEKQLADMQRLIEQMRQQK
jgi:hypothetical protein